MTDLEKFIELYKSVGIDLAPITDDDGLCLKIEQGNHGDLVDGYSSFFTLINFDLSGEFVSQGIWE